LETQFNIFIPDAKEASGTAFPVLTYLAGLTCNEDTGAWKGGFLPTAASEGIALVFPDTSPRGAKIEGEDDDWDFGTGAGFYIDATAGKWAKNYRMFSFITQELPEILKGLDLPLVCID
jgi:S-formylglutathione hydrolase